MVGLIQAAVAAGPVVRAGADHFAKGGVGAQLKEPLADVRRSEPGTWKRASSGTTARGSQQVNHSTWSFWGGAMGKAPRVYASSTISGVMGRAGRCTAAA